jgi:hypothetical protein
MKGQPCSGDPRRRDPCGAQAKTPSRPWEEPRIDYGFTQAVDRDTAVLISPVLVVVLVVVGSRVATPWPPTACSSPPLSSVAAPTSSRPGATPSPLPVTTNARQWSCSTNCAPRGLRRQKDVQVSTGARGEVRPWRPLFFSVEQASAGRAGADTNVTQQGGRPRQPR